jgi:hypothetical protein
VEDTDIFFNLTKLIGHFNDGDAPIQKLAKHYYTNKFVVCYICLH